MPTDDSRRNVAFAAALIALGAGALRLIDLLRRHGPSIIKDIITIPKNIKKALDGKSICIIGPKRSGKTTLIQILKDPDFDVGKYEYEPTVYIDYIKNFTLKYKMPIQNDTITKSVKIKLRKPKDVGGELEYRVNGFWLEACRESEIIFYIIDSSAYNKTPGVQKRIYDDFKWIAHNNQKFKQNFKIIVFINKIDLLGDKQEQQEWIKENLNKIYIELKNSLGWLKNNLVLTIPVSLLSKSDRCNAISKTLIKISQANS